MKKSKKGFTLVELLAVIIVLIIIIFIAINKIRESNLKAQYNAMKANAGTYIKAVNELAGVDNLTSDRMYSGSFGKYTLEDYGLKMSGKQPDVVSIYMNDFEVESACISYGKYKLTYQNGEISEPEVGTCVSGDRYIFAYTGTEQVFKAPYSATYQIEAWGAQGGSSSYNTNSNEGGYGGYSTGELYLEEGEELYINVGGKGASITYNQSAGEVLYDDGTGYNGGGYASYAANNSSKGGGGGATSIILSSGLLKTKQPLIDDIIIVAGGGGGASTHSVYPDYSGDGGSGGGYQGRQGTTSSSTCYHYTTGASQTGVGSIVACSNDGRTARNSTPTPDAGFGLGGNYTANNSSYVYAGGGAGFFGAISGFHAPAGGGSGYIGNSNLNNKSMYCYKCPKSDLTDSKTISGSCVDENPTSNCSKKGNGYVRISILKRENRENSTNVYAFGNPGNEYTFEVPQTGKYKLEVWGAQGGGSLVNGVEHSPIGYGAYSVGFVNLTAGETLYINVGGKGEDAIQGYDSDGGYNGGGSGTWDHNDNEAAGGGGGATHIATKSGLLSTLSEDIDKILIVAGGGGGRGWDCGGGSGGGIEGVAPSSTPVANQTSGYSFGKGEDATGTGNNDGHGGGGGGFYGGYESRLSSGSAEYGGGGSGYIGNESLTDKSMYCFNCTESTEVSTKTISGLCFNATAAKNCTKVGNGYARITFVE